jgi:hypothetical protein
MIIEFLFGALVMWLIAENTIYSPKARIERLWKEIFAITTKIVEQEKRFGKIYNPLVNLYEKENLKKKKMINALLEYYFKPEEDEEYIRENKP